VTSTKQCINKCNKIIQDLKRRILNTELEQYEMRKQRYEHLYQQDLTVLQLQILKPSSSEQKCPRDELMRIVKLYLNRHTNKMIHQVCLRVSHFYVKLIRQHRRHHSVITKIIDVYPQVIVDVPNFLESYSIGLTFT
jgi:hypothetical protein